MWSEGHALGRYLLIGGAIDRHERGVGVVSENGILAGLARDWRATGPAVLDQPADPSDSARPAEPITFTNPEIRPYPTSIRRPSFVALHPPPLRPFPP